MKKVFLVIALTIIYTPIKAQISCIRDSLLYTIAYNYILSDTIAAKSNIFPSDRLTNTSYSWFAGVINSSNDTILKNITEQDYDLIPPSLSLAERQKNETALLLKLQRMDEKTISHEENKLRYHFPTSFKNSESKSYQMLFSAINNDEFFVCLDLPATFMGGGYIYYFIFTPDITLRNVYMKEIHGL